MPSQRYIQGLNSAPKRTPKPVTPLQEQLQARRKLDEEQASTSTAALLKKIADNDAPPRPVPLGDEIIPPEAQLNNLAKLDDGHQPDDEDHVEAIDMNRFMPLPNHVNAPPVDPVLAALRRDQHLADRLAHENQWNWQYAVMLPTFLRCRMETSNWGDEEKWKADLREPCTCAIRTERNVDLVDLTSRRRVKVSFCKYCDLSDPVRLLQMGYIASSPSQPRTAFSVRLLVHHHNQWVRYAVPTHAFCEGLDESLDSHNPVILTHKGNPRDWRQPFTVSVDAFRALNNQIRELEYQKLQLTELGKLAANCPKCFGPPIGNTRPEEPQVLVCLDGNFQHKRHAKASVPIPGSLPPRPEIFLDPKIAEAKEQFLKLANDARGKGHFKNMDESGLLGLACRQDHITLCTGANSMATRLKYQAELQDARRTLARYLQQNPTHTTQYFQTQWDRQRKLQLKAISVRSKEKRERLEVLIKLEEDLLEVRQQMRDMDAAHAPMRTAEQRNELLALPRTLANLELKIQEVADEVGNTELLNVRRRGNDQVKAVLTVQVALGFLYEAKFGADQQQVEAARRTGTHAARYNEHYQPAQPLYAPSFDEVVAMDMLHPFWDEVALNHPDEPWASCQITKEGMVALRSQISSEEELRRLGREVRQMMGWGIEYQGRMEASKPHEENARVLEWNSIHSGLEKRTCCLWKQWNQGLLWVLHATKEYVEGSDDFDDPLIHRWQQMVDRTAETWQAILGVPIYWVEEEEDGLMMLFCNKASSRARFRVTL
ncbi:hypothetical protein DFH28DRAFT_1082087 [Melampsora americana]|nr:hypothetical protein DFH28DRAFT_1082087 [Melampsora americana]